MDLKEIVKGTTAKLSYICNSIAYFSIEDKYQFPINLNEDEWKNVYIYPEYKSITLMRWIRKAINNNELTEFYPTRVMNPPTDFSIGEYGSCNYDL